MLHAIAPPALPPQDAQEQLDAFCHAPMDCRQRAQHVFEVQRVGRTHRWVAAQQVRGRRGAPEDSIRAGCLLAFLQPPASAHLLQCACLPVQTRRSSPMQAYHVLLPVDELLPGQLAGRLAWLGRRRLASLQLGVVSEEALAELAHAPASICGALRELTIVQDWPGEHAFREAAAAALAPFTHLERLTLQRFGSVLLPSLPLSIRQLTLVLPDPTMPTWESC